MYGQLANAYSSFRDSDFSYGFLPTPKFDETQKSYINCCTDRPWAIPITVSEEQLDLVGTVCEALSCRNYTSPVYKAVQIVHEEHNKADKRGYV